MISSAFPSKDVWYIGGGTLQLADAGPEGYQGLITKTIDGSKTFKTVFNHSGPASNPGAGYGTVQDIDCVDTETCYAVTGCCDTACGDGIYYKNHSHGYGGYLFVTTDGGKQWNLKGFTYETCWNAVKARASRFAHFPQPACPRTPARLAAIVLTTPPRPAPTGPEQDGCRVGRRPHRPPVLSLHVALQGRRQDGGQERADRHRRGECSRAGVQRGRLGRLRHHD